VPPTVDGDRVSSLDARPALLVRALRLSYLSVGWGTTSGIAAVAIAQSGHSLGVLAVGLGLLADAAGSVAIIWRARVERHDRARAQRAETRASLVVATALLLSALVLTGGAIRALVNGTHPVTVTPAIVSAGANVAVLGPLGAAKRRLGALLGSAALRGDGLLSVLAAVSALFALVGLAVETALGWWWVDRAVGLLVAAVAIAEAVGIVSGVADSTTGRPAQVR
jgi:divalent metal cation (Fe/Co/Zn/Cd) transporter